MTFQPGEMVVCIDGRPSENPDIRLKWLVFGETYQIAKVIDEYVVLTTQSDCAYKAARFRNTTFSNTAIVRQMEMVR